MRLVFFGSGDFGIPTLDALAAAGHDIPLVVSQPDKPAGRGGRTRPTPLRARAEELGLAVRCPDKPNAPEFETELRAAAPELCVVVAYGHLIRANLLAVPPRGFINLHASLLPRYRGAAPVPWAILNGDAESGVSVFRLDARFDTGMVLAMSSLPIEATDTSGSYLTKLAPVGGELTARVVADIAAGRAEARAQDESRASAAPKFTKEDGRIDWSRPFAEIERQVRALQPWPQAFTVLETAKGPLRATVAEVTPAASFAGGAEPGTVLCCSVAGGGLVIASGDVPARLTRLRPEGKRVMNDGDFLCGTKVLQ